MRAAQKLLGALTIGVGECPVRGWWWRESKESNSPMPPEIYDTGEKTCGFLQFLAYESPKMSFFA